MTRMMRVSTLALLVALFSACCCDAFAPPHRSSSSSSIGKTRLRDGTNGLLGPKQSIVQASSTETAVSSTAPSPLFSSINPRPMNKISSAITKFGMISFIIGMCIGLPLVLLPQLALYKMGLISKIRKEQWALRSGQFVARWMLRLFPFCKLDLTPYQDPDPQPAIWVCNHTSALDIFMLLAADLKLRGKKKRPIKIVYWKGLEDNPVTKLLFQQCGFIPVEMAANKAGEDNDYDMKSFKNLLKLTKQAFDEGFDIGILPEGQLNPNPEESLLPCFSGGFTLARMSKRPIHMMALHGTHRLWHAREDIGMTVTGRRVKIRVYPGGRKFTSADEFLAAFHAVVGQFATKGVDLPEEDIKAWLDGSQWEKVKSKQAESS